MMEKLILRICIGFLAAYCITVWAAKIIYG